MSPGYLGRLGNPDRALDREELVDGALLKVRVDVIEALEDGGAVDAEPRDVPESWTLRTGGARVGQFARMAFTMRSKS